MGDVGLALRVPFSGCRKGKVLVSFYCCCSWGFTTLDRLFQLKRDRGREGGTPVSPSVLVGPSLNLGHMPLSVSPMSGRGDLRQDTGFLHSQCQRKLGYKWVNSLGQCIALLCVRLRFMPSTHHIEGSFVLCSLSLFCSLPFCFNLKANKQAGAGAAFWGFLEQGFRQDCPGPLLHDGELYSLQIYSTALIAIQNGRHCHSHITNSEAAQREVEGCGRGQAGPSLGGPHTEGSPEAKTLQPEIVSRGLPSQSAVIQGLGAPAQEESSRSPARTPATSWFSP